VWEAGLDVRLGCVAVKEAGLYGCKGGWAGSA
jgi:hypothetical protein